MSKIHEFSRDSALRFDKKTVIAFFLGKTLPVLKLGCVLSQDFVAFCLEDFLHFVSRPLLFVSRLGCVLSQDLLRFVSRLTAFCLQSVAFCLQASCVLSTFEDLFLSFGPYQMGTVRETLAEGTEGAPQFGPERPRVYSDLSPEENIDIWDNVKMLLEWYELTKEDRESQLYDDFEHFRHHKGKSIHDYYVRFAKLINDMRNIKMTMSRMQLNSKFVNNMLPEWGRFVTAVKLNRGLKDSNYDQLGQGMNLWGGGATGYGEGQNRVGNVNPGQARSVKYYNCNDTENVVALDAEQILFLAGGQDNAFDDDVDEQHVHDLALNMDNVFQADDCDVFDSDVDEAPTAQTMFIANLSSAYPVTDEAGPSYDSDILSEVQDHDHYQDAVCAHHEEHAMRDSVQLNHIVDSHADYTSDSNMIQYDQYVKDNEVLVVHSNVSSVPNDAFMMIYKDMCELHANVSLTHHGTQ
nr:hypothetical protein [Tanacetum cinerariifolium]